MRGGLGGLLLFAAVAHAEGDLVDRLCSDDWAVLNVAIADLRALPPADAVRLAPSVLRVDEPLVRTVFLQVLVQAGPAAAPAVPGLLAACFDEDAGVRGQAGQVLAAIGPGAWKAISLLPEIDRNAARAMRQAMGEPDQRVPDLWADEEWKKVGQSLGVASDLPALEEALRHPHPYVQHRAEAELKRREALPSLDRLAGDPSVRVRRRAAGALAALFSVEGAVPILAARLRDPDTRVRMTALSGLGAAGAVELLAAYAETSGKETLITTIHALEQARPGASHPLIRRALRSDDALMRQMAVTQVAYLGTSARPLLDDMIDMLFDEVAAIREVAQRSLLAIGGQPDEVAPWLRELPGVRLQGVLAASGRPRPPSIRSARR